MGSGSSLGRFLVKYQNNLNTISDCQNDEIFNDFITVIYNSSLH